MIRISITVYLNTKTPRYQCSRQTVDTGAGENTAPVGAGAELRTVSYQGALQQALRDVSAWIERGVEPAVSTSYKVVDAQVEVPPTAESRKGIQPVVELKVNGGVRAEVAVGQPVTLTATIEIAAQLRQRGGRGVELRGRGQLCPWGVRRYPTSGKRQGHSFLLARWHLFPGSAGHFTTGRQSRHSVWACPEPRSRAGRRQVGRQGLLLVKKSASHSDDLIQLLDPYVSDKDLSCRFDLNAEHS
jgi:hypothetical protein